MTISFIFGDIFKKEVPPCQAQFHIGFYNHVKIKKKQLMSQSQEIVQIVILSILIVTLSLVIALVSLFLHLFVIVSQLNLFLNLLMWTQNVCEWFSNRKSSCQNGFTKPFSAMINFHDVHIFLWINSFIFISHDNFCNNNVDNFFKRYVRCNNFPTN